MEWLKKGRIYQPPGDGSWRHQFAMLPTPLIVAPDRLRIYLGFCDPENIGRVGFVDVDPADPSRVLGVSPTPVLDIGAPGAFDDHGVVPASILRLGTAIYLYYVGFQLRDDFPYSMFSGLAVSHDGGNRFARVSTVPVLGGTEQEPYARCGVHVRQDGDAWRMWYIGSIGEGWTQAANGKAVPLYGMKTMRSPTHDHWPDTATMAMNFASDDEHGFGRPYVWEEGGRHRMLYSIRTYHRGYQIGYAESADGIAWQRRDGEAGLHPSGDGWESESLAYPYLYDHGATTYAFYNGNGCGKTGLGYAVRKG